MKCIICNNICTKSVVHGKYTYWKCCTCHTDQILPQPSTEELFEYYKSFHLSESSGGIYDEIEDRMQADFPSKINKIFNYYKSDNIKLLDVGCGKGFFIKEAQSSGIKSEGIDISESGIKYAVDELNVKATIGNITEKADEWSNKFDVITLLATIEHVPDPLAVIRAINTCLKSGGVLLCDTGLGHVFFERLLPGHNQWYDAPQHLFVFSEQGLTELLESSGFTVIHKDFNYDRTLLRRWIRICRHTALCVLGFLSISPLLGSRGRIKMKQESKWPIGKLLSIVAQKN